MILSDIIDTVKELRYTRHAKNRMRWHKITESEVESAIQHPDSVEPSMAGKVNVWIKTSDKFLRVTYKETDKILVITAVKKRKGWR